MGLFLTAGAVVVREEALAEVRSEAVSVVASVASAEARSAEAEPAEAGNDLHRGNDFQCPDQHSGKPFGDTDQQVGAYSGLMEQESHGRDWNQNSCQRKCN